MKLKDGIQVTTTGTAYVGAASKLLRSDGGTALFDINTTKTDSPTYVWGFTTEHEYYKYQTSALSVYGATVLTTPRTIWGQSFDGSANISGNMTGVGTITASGNNTITKTTIEDTYFRVTNSNGSVTLLTSAARGIYDVTKSTWIIATNGTNTWLSQGNVGIGTTSPGYKLDIVGSARVSSQLISSVATGTSPLILKSTTLISNLNADSVDDQHFTYSNTTNSPTYLWATNSSGSSFLAARDSISVNYATSAGSTSYATSAGFATSATKLTTISKTAWGQTYWTSGGVPTSISGMLTSWAGCATNITDVWSDGTNSHPWYGIDHRYSNTGVYSTTISDYYGLLLRTSAGYISMTNAGNVGIGTTSPSYKLHVSGTACASGNTSIGGTLGVTGVTTLSSTLGVSGATTLNSSLSVSGVADFKGNVKIFYSTPYIDFYYNNSTANYTSRIIENTSGRLSITGKLNVGTTTNYPDYSLYANGAIYANGTIYTGSIHNYINTYGSYLQLHTYGNEICIGGNGNTQMHINYRAATGTTPTEYVLHSGSNSSRAAFTAGKISGTSIVNVNSSDQYVLLGGGGTKALSSFVTSSTDTKNTAGATASSNKLYLIGVTTVGVSYAQTYTGPTSDSLQVYMQAGEMFASAYYQNSDFRLKKDITNISEETISKAANIDLRAYKYKHGKRQHYGVIAQELEQVGLEELVQNGDEYKTVDYISLLILKVRYLEEELKKLKGNG